jgi:hypothetical protein
MKLEDSRSEAMPLENTIVNNVCDTSANLQEELRNIKLVGKGYTCLLFEL